MDGVLISCDKTQKHIRAYATGYEKAPVRQNNICCPYLRFNGVLPPFIGNDYYCDSEATPGQYQKGSTLHYCLAVKKGCTPQNFYFPVANSEKPKQL